MSIFTVLLGFLYVSQTATDATVQGAWQTDNAKGNQVLLIRDGYFSLTEYSVSDKAFVRTMGGTFAVSNGKASVLIEFNSMEAAAIGKKHELDFVVNGNTLQFEFDGFGGTWKQIDDGKAPLAGNWRISGRLQDGQMSPIPRRDRKTLKLLTGTRFQWFAINPATKEFFGTGGGTYRFENGKYIETIEFFSRDSSRVGASLEFDGRVDGDNWYHSGKSSRGEPLNEVWARETEN